MPRGDGTGPNGSGPLTGRQAGNCDGAATPEVQRSVLQSNVDAIAGMGQGRMRQGRAGRGPRRRGLGRRGR